MAFGATFRTFAVLASVHIAWAAYDEMPQTAPHSAHKQSTHNQRHQHRDLMRRKVVNVARPGERANHVVVEYREGSGAEVAIRHLTREQLRFAARWPSFFSNMWNNVKKAASNVAKKVTTAVKHMASEAGKKLKAQIAKVSSGLAASAQASLKKFESGDFKGALESTKSGLKNAIDATKKAAATLKDQLKGDLTTIQKTAIQESHKAVTALADEHKKLLDKLNKGGDPKKLMEQFYTMAKGKQESSIAKVQKIGEDKAKSVEAAATKAVSKSESSEKALQSGVGR